MNKKRILVAGIGNIFFGDDGFGVEVVKKLAENEPPPGVRVMDVGIRGIDLTYALMEGWDATILVDATARGGKPGTLYVVEPSGTSASEKPLDAHGLDPGQVLTAVRASGTDIGTLRLVGCEPGRMTAADETPYGPELSPEVQAAIEPAVRLVRRLVDEASGANGASDA